MAKTAERDVLNESFGEDDVKLLKAEAAAQESLQPAGIDERIASALALASWVGYLLSRKSKQRIGSRTSFTRNAVATYLSYTLGGEWLAINDACMNSETMEQTPLPRWMEHMQRTLAESQEGRPSLVVDEVIRATLGALAELSENGDLPF